MRPGRARTAFVAAAMWPMAAGAADLAYDGQAGAAAQRAADALRSHAPGFDRSAVMPSADAVADAVRSNQAAGGVILAMTADGVANDTARLLLGALDPDVRVTGEADIADASGGTDRFWMIVRSAGRMPEQHPDRLVVTVEAPGGSKAFSLVVAGLSKIGFTVLAVASVAMPGKPFGYRYLLALAADRPVLVLRATDAMARDSRVGEGRALLIGEWKRGS
jgi:prephenate dehydratase